MALKQKNFTKIAIANRGEVAVRIIHACREMGIQTVLLHSEPDVNTLAYRLADERQCVGPAPTAESYLNISANVAAAKRAGAQAIHPGFGFLSENADFAEAVENAGIIFIGPRPQTIRQCGDKISAKALVQKTGAPLVPGYQGEDQSVDHLIAQALSIGFPVIVKAAAGGGGRGMKVIENKEAARELIESAKRESLSAFGSEKVFLEKYLRRAKHIEVQVFGDGEGGAVHLLERECSVQRRHQKIIEEAPSAALTPALRGKITAAAVELAKSVKYRGAGTVEFLLEGEDFYFMEMNTRLQVEHPVTEMILGVDLVKAQIGLAQGTFQLWRQEDLAPRGHAIECRVYAEDPYRGGIPSIGPLLGIHWPHGPGRRFEYGFEAGDTITSHYDPMIAKVIVRDETRRLAIQKMLSVLDETVVFGIHTNIPFLKKILQHAEFGGGTMTTQFIGQHFANALAESPALPQELLQQLARLPKRAAPLVDPARSLGRDPWVEAWRNA